MSLSPVDTPSIATFIYLQSYLLYPWTCCKIISFLLINTMLMLLLETVCHLFQDIFDLDFPKSNYFINSPTFYVFMQFFCSQDSVFYLYFPRSFTPHKFTIVKCSLQNIISRFTSFVVQATLLLQSPCRLTWISVIG